VVSGTIGEETAVAAMRAGAHDYLMKSNLRRLVPAIQRELREAEVRRRRAAAESALATERDRSHLVMEGVSAMIVGVDPAGRITLFNRAAEAISGFRREEVLGRSVRERVEAVGRGEGPRDAEAPLCTASGEERIISWRYTALRGEPELAGAIAFGVDVTERRQAEVRRTAIEHLARRSEKLAAVGTLAAGIAHELNNPIGIISSRIELMLLDDEEARALPAAARQDLEVLHRQAQRVARITQGLLSLARQPSDERAPVDMNRVVDEVLLLAGPPITKRGVTIQMRLTPGLPWVIGDGNALQQVVLNLVTNAGDAIEGAGEIRVETRRRAEGPEVELSVEDTGHGIRAEDLERIFHPFFTTKATGTGLGLSITHGIVQEHGGIITVDSAVGAGTRVVVALPAADDGPALR
jgi:PAS domain S-box-containing protein